MPYLNKLFYLPCLLSLVCVLPAFASDGALEINQTCAENGGCFPGDNAGFPVTITSPGSYVLTGNIDLGSLESVTAIEVQVPGVNLNLGGFELAGPVTCTGTGPSISCNPTSDGGHGVDLFAAAIASSVSNGTVRGFHIGVVARAEGTRISDLTSINNSNDGFHGTNSILVNNCVSLHNGEDGFDGDSGSMYRGLIAIGNGNHGIEIDAAGGVVMGSTSRGNGDAGFDLVALSKFGHDNVSTDNSTPDNCGGGICSERRRYYLTKQLHDGLTALSACATGFHMASIWEVRDTTLLAYDTVLGRIHSELGSGPPAYPAEGWITTGVSESIPGQPNCSGYTSNSPELTGTVVRLPGYGMLDPPATKISPWIDSIGACSADYHVWCLED